MIMFGTMVDVLHVGNSPLRRHAVTSKILNPERLKKIKGNRGTSERLTASNTKITEVKPCPAGLVSGWET